MIHVNDNTREQQHPKEKEYVRVCHNQPTNITAMHAQERRRRREKKKITTMPKI
jgi:hypothetical protein